MMRGAKEGGGRMERERISWKTTIRSAGENGGAYVEVPFDLRERFGCGRMKVCALFDGVLYYGSIVNMGVKRSDGSICYILGIPKAIRTRIEKKVGDSVEVSIEKRE